MEKEMICIVCPVGCHLKVSINDETQAIEISNNSCQRGPIYAKQELTNPQRSVCSTVRVKNGVHPMCPVKTQQAVPKDKQFDVISAIKKIEVQAPIRMGDILVENICGLGVNVIATRNLDQQS